MDDAEHYPGHSPQMLITLAESRIDSAMASIRMADRGVTDANVIHEAAEIELAAAKEALAALRLRLNLPA